MAIPSVVKRPFVVILVILYREVAVFEPHDFYVGSFNTAWIEFEIIHTDKPVGGKLELIVDAFEPAIRR